MGKLFDMDSPVMRFLGLIGDMLILNIIMIICCIPIITVGAAYTAMHYVLLKMVRGEEGYLVKGFFKSFVRNFKQATLLWLLMLLIIGIFVGDILIFSYSGITFSRGVVIAVMAVAVILLFASMYVFPVLARFDNTIRNTLKNAVLFAFINFPKTILMAVFYALPLVIGYFSPYSYIYLFMFGISIPSYGAAWLYSGLFKKYEPEPEVVSDMDFSLNIESGEEEINGESE